MHVQITWYACILCTILQSHGHTYHTATLSSRLRPNLSSTTSRAAHFQFVPETPNPADGNKIHCPCFIEDNFHFLQIKSTFLDQIIFAGPSEIFAGPTEKMTLLQSVTDALDIALTKVL